MCIPFEISALFKFGFFCLVNLWIIRRGLKRSGCRRFNQQTAEKELDYLRVNQQTAEEELDYRRINQQTVEEALPILNNMLEKESESVTWGQGEKIRKANQFYLDALNILKGPNSWTNWHHWGSWEVISFPRHDDADDYLAEAAELITQIRTQLGLPMRLTT